MVSETIFYFFSTIISRGLPLVFLGYFANKLGAEEFGRFSIYQVAMLITYAVLSMSVTTVILRERGLKTVSLINDRAVRVVFLNHLIALPFFLIATFVSPLFILFLLYSLFNSFISLLVANLRVEYQAKKVFLLECTNAVLAIVFSLLFIELFRANADLRVLGVLLSTFIVGTISILIFRRYLRGMKKFYVVDFKLYRFLLPLLPHSFSIVVISMSDRVILEHQLGLSIVGVYSALYMLSSVQLIFGETLMRVLTPYILSNNQIINTRLYFFVFMILNMCSSITLFFLAKFYVVNFLSIEYAMGLIYLDALIMAFWLYSIYQFAIPFLVKLGKTNLIAFASVSSAILNVVATLIFVRYIGVEGAAYGTAVAYFSLSLFVGVFLLRAEK